MRFLKWHEYVSSIHININIQLHQRKCQGVIDTALRTANSGYLYRRMDFTASPVVVSWLHLSNRIGISEAVFNPTSISNDKHIRGFFEVTSPDCGTEEGVPMPFKKRKPAEAGFADRIRGRVLAGDVLHPKDSSLLFKKG